MRPIHANLEQLAKHLVQQRKYEQLVYILDSLEQAQGIKNCSDWYCIFQVLMQIPKPSLFESDGLLRWYASVLIALRDDSNILAISSNHAAMLAARAWVLMRQQKYSEAEAMLLTILERLSGKLKTFSLKNLALIYSAQGKPWQNMFNQAKKNAQGRDIGLCLIDEGGCYDRIGDSLTARDLWLEALPLLKTDPYHLAWLRYNLGISCAKDLLPDAERHFYELQRLAQKPDLKAWQSRAWSGLGVTHRIRGEWERAIYVYHRALQTALEPDDSIEATSSLALSLRLASRIPEALEVLVLSEHQSPAIEVQKVACYLAAQNPVRAKKLLESVQTSVSADQIRLAYYRAELARLEQNPNAALVSLETVPLNHLVAREEAMYWQSLRGLCQAMNLQVPVPLEYTENLNVSVYALGGLQVLVNARVVHLEPRTAELLVLLLEHHRVAHLATVALLLFPESSPKTAQSNVRRLLVSLRDALSWSGAVVLDNKTIILDRTTQWFYDVTEARNNGDAHAEFLPNASKPWMLEIAAQLRLLGKKFN